MQRRSQVHARKTSSAPVYRPVFCLAMFVTACVFVFAYVSATAIAQPVQMLKQSGLPLGDPCTRRTDARAGVVKRDACGRVYCGRRDLKDITETMPEFSARHACTWRLEGAHCKCRRPGGQQKRKLR